MAPVAQDVEGGRPCTLPAALDGERVLADQARRYLVDDDALDLEQAGVLVACIGLADNAFVGLDARDDRRAVGHVVVAAAERSRERHADRGRLDRSYPEAADGTHSPFTAPETRPRTKKRCPKR